MFRNLEISAQLKEYRKQFLCVLNWHLSTMHHQCNEALFYEMQVCNILDIDTWLE